MGDSYSDWQGVKHTFTAGSDITSGMDNKITMKGTTVSNARLGKTYDSYEAASSSFEGWVSLGGTGGDPFGKNKDPDRCVFTIVRTTEDSEADKSDGSLYRF